MLRALIVVLSVLNVVSTSVVAQEGVSVRVTFYTDCCLTYSGGTVAPGTAACSWGWPLGTRLRFVADGREVVCTDRGLLGGGLGWIDVWVPSLAAGRATVAGAYGDYTTVVEVRDRLDAAVEEDDS